jgi:hypothetical protein
MKVPAAPGQNPPLRLAEQVYRILLFAYPSAFRCQYGDGMMELFLSRHQQAQCGLRSRVRFWAEILTFSRHEAAVGGCRERGLRPSSHGLLKRPGRRDR